MTKPIELTDRQVDVLGLVAMAYQNGQIAHQLNLSEHTIRKHLEDISERLGTSGRISMIFVAGHHQIIDLQVIAARHELIAERWRKQP